jgi:hypothetical protein
VSDSTPCSRSRACRSGSRASPGRPDRRSAERIATALAPYDTGRQYLNFTEASTDPARFYRPDVFHRLRAVKAAYDPDDLFRANHPIPLAR